MKYEIHLTSKDMFGQDVVDNLLEMGKLGAVKKEGTFAHMKFPYTVYLELEAEEPPMPSAQVRVFDHKKKEVFANVLADQIKQKEKAEKKAKGKNDSSDSEESSAANFSVELDEVEDNSALANSPSGAPWTKEQLDDLDWDVLKKVVSTKQLKGRDRQKLTKQYLEVVANEQKEAESKTE